MADAPHDERILKEEIFGPVAPIATFRNVDEAAHDGLMEFPETKYIDELVVGCPLPAI